MSTIILRTNSLSKIFASSEGIRDVSVKVEAREIYALLGRGGSGKSTLLNILTGSIAATSGNFTFFESTDVQSEYARIGYVAKMPSLNMSFTIAENLEYYAKVFGIASISSLTSLARSVDIDITEKKKVRKLPFGIQRKLSLAVALLGKPDLLLMDEPFNGLDAIEKRFISNFLLRLSKRENLTIFLTGQRYEEVSKIATRYGIINNGRIVDEFTAATLSERCNRCIKIRTKQTTEATSILEKICPEYEILSDDTIRVFEVLEKSGFINTSLVSAGITVDEISITGENEEIYITNLMGVKKG
ncbi:ABC transporter ATP-binding protein [Planococcus alpniumensis]|uniref:ABC transporter ATP-binding protein n=1 Tax=Planococcus alpniumensis TaxID=2708345 RepID=UPI001B8B056D|nr:ABC transporter ATP-binding protein [Planococcus sp. MSAK28401]